jgi:WD40 repeat protein
MSSIAIGSIESRGRHHASKTFKTGGSVSHTTLNPDGTWTVAGTGLNTIILFPTDTPAGPSTVLYIGRIVYTLEQPGVENIFTLQSFKGTSKDICEVLSA